MRRKMLIVEDDYLQADDCARIAEEAGFHVVGPVSNLQDAMAELDGDIDCALLDINLQGVKAYPLLDKLLSREIPVAVFTGYDHLPPPYDQIPVVLKPADCAEAVRTFT
ncbi:response regulator [Bradyrhizobium sp. 18BD]